MLPAKGVYALIVMIPLSLTFKAGGLKEVSLSEGLYIYVGSALGQGLLPRRVARHLSFFKKLRWHVDYLLTLRCVKVVGVVASYVHEKLECDLVRKLLLKGFKPTVRGFGSSDCRCYSHLLLSPSQEVKPTTLLVEEAIRELGAEPMSVFLENLKKTQYLKSYE